MINPQTLIEFFLLAASNELLLLTITIIFKLTALLHQFSPL